MRGRLRWLAAHAAVVGALTLAALTWWATDRDTWALMLVTTGCFCVGLGAVMEGQPRWWRRLRTAGASRRRLAFYREQWPTAMAAARLDRDGQAPQLAGHRFGGGGRDRDLDVLTVHPLPGQTLADWKVQCTLLAAAWGRTRVRAHPQRGAVKAPAVLELYCSSRPVPSSTAVGNLGDSAPAGLRAFPRTPRADR